MQGTAAPGGGTRAPFPAAAAGSYLTAMVLRIGTSGYSYKEWKGVFYPESLKAAEMLAFYGQRLGTVEINNTFYRLPTRSLLEGWAGQVPDGFRFVLKVAQKITHFKRLKGVDEEVSYLTDTAAVMGAKLGALLVQLPPNFACDAARLDGFLGLLPASMRAALEVRHASWRNAEVLALLEKRGVALVTSETDEEPNPDLTRTTSWGYLRLRKSSYSPAELSDWSRRIAATGWDEAFVFFKHEQIAPDLAQRLAAAGAA